MQSPPLSPPMNSILVDRRADSQSPMATSIGRLSMNAAILLVF